MIENMLYLFITISFASAIALIESSYLVEESIDFNCIRVESKFNMSITSKEDLEK